jgi:maltooligosyltrehalose trehalohydrolase
VRGEPSSGLPPSAFINFLQNHDQIGNRAFGERLSTLIDAKKLEVVTALLMLSPFTPLIFMGEEWAERRPFLYFTDFDGELGRAVREGRRNEFRKWSAFADPTLREKIPDPNDLATARSSMIDWSNASEENRHLALMKRLLKLRKDKLASYFRDIKLADARGQVCGPKAVWVRWPISADRALNLYCNLGDGACEVPPLDRNGEILFASRDLVQSSVESGSLSGTSIVFSLVNGSHG